MNFIELSEFRVRNGNEEGGRIKAGTCRPAESMNCKTFVSAETVALDGAGFSEILQTMRHEG